MKLHLCCRIDNVEPTLNPNCWSLDLSGINFAEILSQVSDQFGRNWPFELRSMVDMLNYLRKRDLYVIAAPEVKDLLVATTVDGEKLEELIWILENDHVKPS